MVQVSLILIMHFFSDIFNNSVCYALSSLILGFYIPLFEEDIFFLPPQKTMVADWSRIL